MTVPDEATSEATTPDSRDPLSNAWILLTLAPLLWGGNAVAGKIAAAEWLPFTFTSLRWGCATLVLLPLAWRPLQHDWPLVRQNLVLLFLLGGVGMCLFNLSMYLALNYTSAINVSIEQAAIPVLIMAANFLFLSQQVKAWQAFGLTVSIVGVFVTVTQGDPLSFFASGLNRGDALMLLASVFYAAYSFGLRWRPTIHWLSFMLVISVSAFIVTLPFAGWELTQQSQAMPGMQGFLVLLYVAIFPTIFSQIAWARGVELIGANRAGLFINLVPIFGSMLAVLIIGEQFRWYHALGLIMVIGGIVVAERAARRSV